MQNGIPVGLRSSPSFGLSRSGQLTAIIQSLFWDGSQGWWYDDNDTTTLFQDSAGTTPVTAVEQFVGLQLDKSKGLVVGSTIATYDFASATGWSTVGTVAITGGEVVFTAAIDQRGIYRADAIFSVAQYYEITFTITSISSGAISVSVGQSSGNTQPKSTAGTHTVRLYGTGADNYVRIYSVGASTTASVDNVIIKVIPGNHRYAPASGNRPIWSKRVNLLTKTEQFDDAVWLKSAASVSVTAAPDSTNTAWTITGDGTSAIHSVRQGYALTGARTFVFIAKAGTNNFLQVFTDGTSNEFANFNLATGAVGSIGSDTSNVLISAYGNGWYICSTTFPVANATTHIRFALITSSTAARGESNTLSTSVVVWRPDLRPANQATGLLPLYQRVNTSTDYETTGFPGYLKADGVDDFLQTNSIDFTATDKITLCAGVRKLSDATIQLLYELSANINTNNGALASAPGYSGVGSDVGPYWNVAAKGTAQSSATTTATFAAPQTAVQTQVANISGDSLLLRINSAQVASSSSDQGTGNFGNYPAYFFRRGGTTFPFTGYEYGNVAVGKLLTADQLTALETYMNGLTKAY